MQFFLSLGLALLLNLDLKLRWLARTLALVPWAMPPVIVAIMWRLMLHPRSGAVNEVLRELGFAGDTNWLGDFKYALPAAILVGVWAGMPQTTITLLAGLQSVPEELHEAAAIDGAGSVRRFFHVTLPALRPIIVAITTLDLINNFNSFALVYVLTAGGPGGKTMLPSLFVYNEAFQYGHWGYAAAMGNVMVIVVGAFLVLYLWAGGDRVGPQHDHRSAQTGDPPAAVPRPRRVHGLPRLPAGLPADHRAQAAERAARSRTVVPPEGVRMVELHRGDRQDPLLDDRPQQRGGRDGDDAA